MAKLMIYITAIVYVQTQVIVQFDEQYRLNQKPDHQFIWMLYEVLLFYFNIVALIIFLIFSRFSHFFTLRERAGYDHEKLLEDSKDFLAFVQDDIHWFTLIFQQLFLCAFALWERKNRLEFSIKGDLLIVLVRHSLDFFMVYYIFFKKDIASKNQGEEKFQFSKSLVIVAFLSSLGTNLWLGFRFKDLI